MKSARTHSFHITRHGCALLLACVATLFVSAQPPSGGGISGQVSNAATQAYLQGAVVQIEGTDRTVYTDREGRFEFDGVPGDSVTLVVSYSGLDTQRVRTAVPRGGVARQDVALTAEVYKLEKFTVAGEREGTALAETLQRQAGNLKNVVSSDTFGNVADGNVGEFLQHVVGITADYNGPDVRQISVRGVSADLNSVTMDGMKVATAQSANFGRAFEFEQASLSNIETIEVTKAASPDMDADSIGGSVNLITKSAFDSKAGRRFNYSVGAVTGPNRISHSSRWKMPIDGFGPSMNVRYSDVLGARQNIGITLTGTMFSKPGGGHTSLLAHARDVNPGPAYTQQAQRRVEGATRTRLASGAKIDYKWSENTTISFSTSYNFFHENNDTRLNNLQYSLPAAANTAAVTNPALGVATLDASGNRTGGGYIHPGYTNTMTRVLAGGTSTFSSLQVTTNDKSGRTFLFNPSVRHRFGSTLIDYAASYSKSSNWYDVSHKNDKYNSRPKGTVSARLNNIGWMVDRSRDLEFPTITQTEGPDLYDLNNYGALTLNQNDRQGHDTVLTAKFNLRRVLPLALPTWAKTGASFQRQQRKLTEQSHNYTYQGPAGTFGQFFDTTGYHKLDERTYASRGGVPPWPNPYMIARHQQVHPELWTLDPTVNERIPLQRDRKIRETVRAAYLMGNTRIDRLSVLGGVRMEETENVGEGPVQRLTAEERARRAAWVGPVTPDEARRRVRAEWGGRTSASGDYRNFFPSVHLKYEVFAGMIARASWSNGIGRPAFGNIVPNNNVNDDALRVSASNPDLRPQYSDNYDLSAEYYFKSQGMISVGAFRKDIGDYIRTDNSQIIGSGPNNGFDGEYEGYTLTTQVNDGFAQIDGLEISYQQQLAFLPGWARGFGVQANFSKFKTKGPNRRIAGFLDRTGNAGVSFRGFGLDLRLLANWRSEYQTSQNANPSLVQFRKERILINWKSRYAVSKRVSVFFDVENIFGEPLDDIYALYPDRVVSLRTFAPKIVFGVEGRL
ncbi:MAG: TonB-dependent receptor [Opitutaceae bacterium]|nr:TonB-dependent receptor [Opitutaceae bacterium]